MSRRGWLLFGAMALIWGIPYLLIKIAVAEISPITLVFFRTALGALLLLPVALARGGFRPLFARWPIVLLYTAVEVAIPWVLLSHAETRLSSSLSGLLIAGVPLVSAVMLWVSGGSDRPDLRRVVGLLVGFAGVAILVGLDVSADDILAVVEIGLVVVGYALGTIIIVRLRELPTVSVIVASLALTAAVYAPFGLTQLPGQIPSPQAIGAVIALAVICTALGFIVYFALVREVGPNRATVITYFNPAVAIALGVLILKEPLTVGIAIGFVMIVFGSFIATGPSAPAPESSALREREPRLT